MELKPGYKSMESWIVAGATSIVTMILGYIAQTDVKPDDVDNLIAVANTVATSVKEVKEIYNMTMMQDMPQELFKLGSFGSTLFFLYKLIIFYVRSRNELKLAIITLSKSKENTNTGGE